MASYTTNYGLHQWAASDDFLRTDFNADHLLIDTALNGLETGKAEMTAGTYTGDGTESRAIELGFQAQALLVERADSRRAATDYTIISGLALAGHPVERYAGFPEISITATGFQLHSAEVNETGLFYHYLALV